MRSILLLCFISGIWSPTVEGQSSREWQKITAKYDQGKVYAGIRKADKQLSGKNPDRNFLVLRADGLNRIGEFARAEHDARQAIPVVPDTLLRPAYLQLGIALMERGMADSARVWLERSLGSPNDSEALLRLGRMDIVAGNNKLALTRFGGILTAEPDHVRALLERGAAFAMLGDTAAARRDLDRAVELNPRDPVTWNSRGFHVHAAQGRHQQAIADYDKAIKLDPNYSFAFNNRGWSLFQIGEVSKARKNITLAARKRASNPYVFRNLGLIELAAGDTAKACVHFRKALSLNFEQLHGPEVSELVQANCGASPAPDRQKTVPPPSNAPGGNTEKKAPTRSNAP